jgi:hypothetical protein
MSLLPFDTLRPTADVDPKQGVKKEHEEVFLNTPVSLPGNLLP